MSKEAMKLALEAQSYAVACLLNQLSTKDKHAYAVEKLNTSTAAIKEALAQPTSAPVQLPQGWSVVLVTGDDTKVWPMTEEQIQAAAFSALGLAEQPTEKEKISRGMTAEFVAMRALAQQEPYIAPNLSTLKHSDNCRYWDDGEYCTCGEAEYHELQYWKAKALAQPAQQEPVAWRYDLKRGGSFEGVSTEYSRVKLSIGENWIPLYTSPPAQRTWVRLTDEEIEQGCKESWVTEQAWQSAVWWAEAKLKEKNT